jgi:hypothetical protein
MIVDIPRPADFQTAGLNQIYLAWQIAMQSLQDYDEAIAYGAEDDAENRREYWTRSQPALANAYSLIQQGMELALKGRIAAVSPLLLIGNPGDWPGRAATEDVSFGELRTLDAADLLKVHNSVATPALDDRFKAFWEEVRRERNKIMHSAAPKSFDPADVVRAILTASEALFPETPWPMHLLQMEEEGRLAALGFNENVQNDVMRQVEAALEHLTPAEARRHFGFNPDQRAYTCPDCHSAANRDWQEVWPRLAQFTTKSRGATELSCIVCGRVNDVLRMPCEYAGCAGDVIFQDLCLTCTRRQEECLEVDSGLTDPSLDACDHDYEFVFGRGLAGSGGYFVGRHELLLEDDRAREHGRLALLEARLQHWDTLSIRHVGRRSFPDPPDQRTLGHWKREGADLIWIAGTSADRPELGEERSGGDAER